MNDQDLLDKAIKIHDPKQRAQFLAEACNKDLEFGNDVESSLIKLVPNLLHSKHDSTTPIKATRNPSSENAVQFCKQLSEAEGLTGFKTIYSSADLNQSGYRLATEAEWEWASRSGASGAAALDNAVPPQGWFFSNAGGAVHPRGQLPGNPWGLYDMLGNVQEWCLDDFDPGTYETRASKELVSDNPLTLPSGLESSGNRIHRGGCIMFPAFMGSSGFRNYRPDNSGSWFTGFRIVKTIQALNRNE